MCGLPAYADAWIRLSVGLRLLSLPEDPVFQDNLVGEMRFERSAARSVEAELRPMIWGNPTVEQRAHAVPDVVRIQRNALLRSAPGLVPHGSEEANRMANCCAAGLDVVTFPLVRIQHGDVGHVRTHPAEAVGGGQEACVAGRNGRARSPHESVHMLLNKHVGEELRVGRVLLRQRPLADRGWA